MAKGKQKQTTALSVPVKAMTVAEIHMEVEAFLNEALEQITAPELYVALKQAEETVSAALAKLKTRAALEAASIMGGSTKGEIFGHAIELRARAEWRYSPAIDSLKDRQREEMRKEQLREQLDGVAKQTTFEPSLFVTLKKS